MPRYGETANVPEVGGPFVVRETTVEDVDPMLSVTVSFSRYTALGRVLPRSTSMGDGAPLGLPRRPADCPSPTDQAVCSIVLSGSGDVASK